MTEDRKNVHILSIDLLFHAVSEKLCS